MLRNYDNKIMIVYLSILDLDKSFLGNSFCTSCIISDHFDFHFYSHIYT